MPRSFDNGFYPDGHGDNSQTFRLEHSLVRWTVPDCPWAFETRHCRASDNHLHRHVIGGWCAYCVRLYYLSQKLKSRYEAIV